MSRESAQWPNRMNASDALFWFLDTVPELRSTIGALMIFGGRPAPRATRAAMARLVAEVPRLRQLVVEAPWNLAPPEWLDDPQFDLDYHLRTIAVPAPGGVLELLEELGPLYASPLDHNRPLWEAYVVEGLFDGRAAMFLKMHHCLMDGVGGSRLFGALLSDPGREGLDVYDEIARGPRSFSLAARVWRALVYDVSEAVGLASDVAGMIADVVLHPWQVIEELPAAVRRTLGFGRELAVPRADSPLRHRRSLSRQLATFEMSLTEIDGARQRLSATNNDIVLTIVSGALHRWHTSRGADVKELRALVPVNLRGGSEEEAGNHLALLAMSLPIGEPDCLTRLRTIQQRMGEVKADRRAVLYPVMARVLTALPLALAAEAGRQQTYRTNLLCTNVPGPRHTCYLAGETIEAVYPFAPLVGDHPVGIAFFSYRDTMYVGLDVDPLAMADLPHFVDALAESYAEVRNVALRAPAAARDAQERDWSI